MNVSATLIPSISITASNTNICSGNSVTYTATSINSGSSPQYQWFVNGTAASGNNNIFSSSVIQNNSVVSCQLTAIGACINTSPVMSNVITMVVNTTVNPSIAITPNVVNICFGSTQTFTAQITNGGSTPTFIWNVNGIISNQTGITFTPTTLGNGDVITCQLTSNALCPSNALVISAPVAVSVTPSVTPTLSISPSTLNTCSGSSVTFTATSTNGGSSPQYQWKINGNNVGPNSPSFTYSNLANGDVVTCVMYSNASCVTASSITSNAITMNVSATLIPSISITASATNICSGPTVIFNTVYSNGGSSPQFQWKVNGNNVGVNSALLSYSNFLNGDIVTCNLTSNATCLTTNLASSNSIQLQVGPNPSSSVIPSGPTTFCSGNNVNLHSSNLNSTMLYQWKKNGINISNANSSNYFASQSGSYTVLVYTQVCPGSESNPIVINVLQSPTTPVISSTSNSIAPGATVTLNCTSTLLAGSVLQWHKNISITPYPISGANSFSYIANSAGTYSLKVTNSNGCYAFSNSKILSTNLLPINNVFCKEDGLYVKLDSIPYHKENYWEYVNEDGLFEKIIFKYDSISNENILPIIQSGFYVLNIIENGKNNKMIPVYENCLVNNLFIYPNPTFNSFKISGIEQFDNLRTISIINYLGTVIKEFENTENNFDISELPVGVYFILLTGSSDKKVLKLEKI